MLKLVAYMSTPGGLTGAPKRLLTLANALRGEGVNVCIVSQSDSELLESAREQEIDTAELDATGTLALQHGALLGGGFIFRVRVLLGLLFHNLRFWRCIRKHRADVVWIRGSKGIAFAGLGAKLSGRRLIWDVDYEPESRGAVRWLHRFGLWASDLVIFQYSAAPKEIFGVNLADKYKAKCRTLVPGIDLSALEHFQNEHAQKESRMHKRFIILQVGTICDRKNQHFTMSVLQNLTEHSDCVSELCVRFVGNTYDEEYMRELRGLAKTDEWIAKIEFLGWRDDVHELMLNADLLVMPSKDEGVPNTVQEAMAFGLPSLVSDVGGMSDAITHGQTGWVIPLSESSAWSEKIEECMTKYADLQLVGNAAAVYARENFSDSNWGASYAKHVKDLA